MSSTRKLAIDTNVFVDSISTDKEVKEDPRKGNVKRWLESIVAETYVEIFSTPTILMEFVSVLYFEKKHEAKKLRHEMMTLQRSFYAFTVVDQSLFEAEGVCVAFNKVSPEHICHVGEVSLLPYLSEPATVFVSSDMEALKAFKLAERLNPSYSPPATAKPGEDIPDG